MLARILALVVLSLCLFVFIGTAPAQVGSITDTIWRGQEQYLLTVKRFGRFKILTTTELDVDSENNWVYAATFDSPFSYSGVVTQQHKKLHIALAPGTLEDLEDSIEGVMQELANQEGIDLGEFSVTVDGLTVSIRARLKPNSVKFRFFARFMVDSSTLGMLPGKVKVKNKMFAIP